MVTFQFETAKLKIQKTFWGTAQFEIKKYLKHSEQLVEDLNPGLTLEMVKIARGSFSMGSKPSEDKSEPNEHPRHQVEVPDFYLGKYPVTQAQYQAIMGENPSFIKGENLPVETVSWSNAVNFCRKLSARTGRHYRLPSEAEWEYACRAGTKTPFHFGKTINTDLVNYAGTYSYGVAKKGEDRQTTTVVGSFPANAFGLYDMHGNVWEWCADQWHPNYNNAPVDGSAWITAGTKSHVIRGGSWNYVPWLCRSASRLDYDHRLVNVGFRVALQVSSPAANTAPDEPWLDVRLKQ
jgi:formylglycine-generating enzyme required for sulfatase activity